MSLKLRQNAVWMMAGNAYYAVCQWLVLVVVARMGGTNEVGIFALALSLCTPVMMFFNLGMRTILASDVGEENTLSDYLIFRATTATLGLIICLGIALWYGQPSIWVIVAVGASKTVETIVDFFYGLNQRAMRLDRIAKSLILRGTIGTASLAIVYYATGSLPMAASCYAVSWIVVLLLFDRRAAHSAIVFDRVTMTASLRNFLKNGVPLGVTALFVNLSPNIPRYVLEQHAGADQLGIFSAMAYFITVGTVVVAAVGQSLVPVLARHYADGNMAAFRTYSARALGFAVGIGLAGVLLTLVIGRFVLTLLYGVKFATHASLFPLFALAATVAYAGNVLGYVISAAKIFVGQAPAFMISVIVSVIASYALIPSMGIKGAAYTMILTSTSNCIVPLILLMMNLSKRSPQVVAR